MKKTIVLVLLLICLMALGMVCVRPVKAQYQGDVTINADGSINPSNAPISRNGTVYTLTINVQKITVQRSNMTLNANGHTVTVPGINFGGGINLNDVSNVTVKNFNITGSQFGIAVSGTSNVIANNTITGTGCGLLSWDDDVESAGIYVEGGGSNVITGNNCKQHIWHDFLRYLT